MKYVCFQATGLGGQAVRGQDSTKVETMTKVEDRLITIKFNADVASSMRWNFRPQQPQVKVSDIKDASSGWDSWSK